MIKPDRPCWPAMLSLITAVAGCTLQSAHDDDAGVTFEDSGLSANLHFAIEPADITLESVDGSTPSVTLHVFADPLVGERFEVTPLRWELDHDRVGTIDERGTFTANGDAGGAVTVRAIVPTTPLVTVETTLAVHLQLTVTPDPSVPRDRIDDMERLPETQDPFGAATLLYPLDGARMPNNVATPDLQWEPIGGAGDLYRVVVRSEHIEVRAYAIDDETASFRSRYRVDPSIFRRVVDSAAGAEITFRVDRLAASGESVISGEPVSITLSEDGLFGTLYYWQVRTQPQSSDVFRLNAASAERTSVFGSSGSSTDCVGCHTVSHDGRHLAATRSSIGGWFTSVVDAASESTPPALELGPLMPAYHTLAWSPSGERILGSRPVATDRNDTRLFLLDGSDGSELDASGLPSGVAGQPTWSPDGALVAWLEGGGDGPDGTAAQTRIVIADATAEGFDARVLHDGGDLPLSPEGGLTDSHPTFSPDSRFIAFAHGTRSISSSDSSVGRPRSALYLVSVEGGDPIRLERGMGPEGPVDAFWPVFSPFVTEEADGRVLYWLAFYSRQRYGNDRAGTGNTHRRQLWLMAIDPALARQGLDPSYPPYWIPGQDIAADDIAAHWAPTACLSHGEECSASSACCSGRCADDGSGALVCLPPETCRRPGESCETAADCCGGSECNLNVCGYQPPI